MALRIVRVNYTHRHPKLRIANFIYPTGHYEGCAGHGTNRATKRLCPGKGHFDSDGTNGECPAAFHLSAQPNFKGFSLL